MAEREFGAYYGGWLERERLVHGAAARVRFAATHPTLCGRSPNAFDRGYARYLTQRRLRDSLASFASYCGPRWRNRELLHRQRPTAIAVSSAAASWAQRARRRPSRGW